jgi:hypothetical protein
MSATLSYLSLAAARYGKRHPRNGMCARAKAARAAGLDSIGVSLDEPLEPAALLYARVVEAEWFDLGHKITNERIAKLQQWGGLLGIRRVNVGVCDTARVPWATLVERVRYLADHVPAMTVCIEPVAFGSLHKVADVLAIIGLAERANVKLLFDMWHVYYDSPGYERPYGIDPDVIGEIQLCGIQVAPYHHRGQLFAASQNRPAVSASAVDVARWLVRLREMGCDAPLSYESPNDSHAHADVGDLACAAADDIAAGLHSVPEPRQFQTAAWCAS